MRALYDNNDIFEKGVTTEINAAFEQLYDSLDAIKPKDITPKRPMSDVIVTAVNPSYYSIVENGSFMAGSTMQIYVIFDVLVDPKEDGTDEEKEAETERRKPILSIGKSIPYQISYLTACADNRDSPNQKLYIQDNILKTPEMMKKGRYVAAKTMVI